MPLPNESNPSCPHCGHSPAKQNGTTAKGTQRYYCPSCRRSFTLGTKHGGQNRIDDGLTPQQRQNIKRKLQRKKIEE